MVKITTPDSFFMNIEYWITYYKICSKLLIGISHDDEVAFWKYYFPTNLSVAKRWYQLSIA